MILQQNNRVQIGKSGITVALASKWRDRYELLDFRTAGQVRRQIISQQALSHIAAGETRKKYAIRAWIINSWNCPIF
jgi:hypothetical protein